MRAFTILLFLSICSWAYADVGSNWPSEAETMKAPAWPKPYEGDPTVCRRVDESAFLSAVHVEGDEPYTVEQQVDLNLDGTCEVIAYQESNCRKWCAYTAFQLRDGKYEQIGEVPLGHFLEPFGGWLQIKTSSYTGASYYYHLVRFLDGGYKYYRRDEFNESNEGKTLYLGTSFIGESE